MTIEEMRQRKRELGLTNQMIAERSGIPLSTVQKVFSRECLDKIRVRYMEIRLHQIV